MSAKKKPYVEIDVVLRLFDWEVILWVFRFYEVLLALQ
jgi:hypothetical protein